MKVTYVFLFFSIIITLAASDRLIIKSIADNNVQIEQNDPICETPACVHEASFVLKNMDSSIDPCENFYQFTCGKFVEETIIPDDETEVRISDMINNNIDEQLRLMVTDQIKEDVQPAVKKMKSYFKTCIDTDQIEKNSENELREVLKNLGGCPVLEGVSWNETNFDWKRSVYEANKMGYDTNAFVGMSIGNDPQNSTRLIITVDQASLELPRENLINGINDDVIKAYLKAAIGYVEILGANRNQAEKEVKETLDFQIKLAKMSLSKEKLRNDFKLNNRMTLHQLEANFTGIGWTEYLNGILSPYAHVDRSEEIIVNFPSFFEGLPRLLAKTPKRVLANYLCIRTISRSLGYMGKAFLNIQTKFDVAASGIREQSSRWKMCLDYASVDFSVVLSSLYVRHYFNKNAKTNAVYLTQNLRNSLRHLIEKANWMDNATKLAALEKLHSMVEYIGYPDELDNDENINKLYQNLTLYPGSFLRSDLNLKQFRKKIWYSHFGKPTDTLNWADHSNVAGAYGRYTPEKNNFDLPAGFLQGHFYNNDRPNYMNYGAIGSVISHELSHAFDDQGSQYDKSGNIVNWWKNGTKEKYLNRAKCIIEQYGNYTVKEVNMKINGIKTQGENIADNVGLKAAYFAYDEWAKNNSKEPRLPGLHYTSQQMFWISFASNWCEKIRPEIIKSRVMNSEHTYAEFRVIGSVSNLQEFSKDFKCPSGSPMNPVKKCSIW